MMQQETPTALLQVRGFEYSADVSFDVFRIETAKLVESQLTEHSGSMAQLSIRDDSRGVIEGRAFRFRSCADGPHTSEPLKADDHRRTFLSRVGFFSAPRGAASQAH